MYAGNGWFKTIKGTNGCLRGLTRARIFAIGCLKTWIVPCVSPTTSKGMIRISFWSTCSTTRFDLVWSWMVPKSWSCRWRTPRSGSLTVWIFYPCRCPSFPKHLDWPNWPKVTFRISLIRRQTSTMWDPYQMPSTTTLMVWNPKHGRPFTSGMTPSVRRSLTWEKNVEILRRCCLNFAQTVKGLCKINPFEHCITIASLWNLIFRNMFLKKETIAIIPHVGYRKKANQSAVAYRWFSYVSHHQGVYIQQGRNVGERLFGWVLRRNTHRLRVSRVFFPRLSQVLSSRHVQFDQRFDHARTVRKNASVLAPRGLYHPVLPFKCQQINVCTVSHLCPSVSADIHVSPHGRETHLHRDVGESGIEPGLGDGYKVVKIHEVWHFPDKTERLFRGYIDMFLKKKQEASGWPGWCQTDQDKEKYLQEYKDKEGIELDRIQCRSLNGVEASTPQSSENQSRGLSQILFLTTDKWWSGGDERKSRQRWSRGNVLYDEGSVCGSGG